MGSDPYGKRSEESSCYDSICDDGAYAYEGGKVELYGARGTAPKSSTRAPTFDDYGRSIRFSSGKDSTVPERNERMTKKRRGWNKQLLFFFLLQATVHIYR